MAEAPGNQMVPYINLVIPAYFPDPHNPALVESFRRFFAQFATQDYQAFDIFLCDSGPPEHHGVIRDLIERLLQDDPFLRPRVMYAYTAVDGPPLSRAEAMNLGVHRTIGDIILFLHLDCILPEGGLRWIADAWAEGARAGGFLKYYEGKDALSPLQATERYLNWIRTVITRQMVGTNAIFMTRELALAHPYQGNFLEDVEMSDWLRAQVPKDRFRIIRKYVTVSAKKYKKQGEFASIAINAAVMTLYRLFHIRPELLKHQLYHRKFPKNWSFWPTLGQTCWALIQGRSPDEA